MASGINAVLASAALSGSQYDTASKAVQTLLNLHLAPVDVAAAASGVQNAGSAADAIGAGISAAKAGLALLEAVIKDVPIAGAALNLGSFSANLSKALAEQNGGGLTNGTALALAGDISALLATAAGLTLTGPAAVALGVGLTVISAGFTVASLVNQSTAGDPLFQEALSKVEKGGRGIIDTTNIDPHTLLPTIAPTTNTNFTAAKNWTPPRDPLVLDLDGDGIEAVGIDPNAPILFDHDGDGTKNATGWIKADDGIVVLDRNGNGLIDSGGELFGDSTVLQNGPRAGQLAANGYEALADLDLNGDGALNSADAAYSQLRIWQDANQDGVSQASELKTLAELGIASINVSGTPSSVNLGNGNTQPFSGSFTRTDGSTGASGVAEVTGSLLLASNNFYREFSDDPVVTTTAAALPQMQGSGWTRDLREAMSLRTAEAHKLQAKMGSSIGRYCARSYKNRSIQTRHQRMALALSRCGKHIQRASRPIAFSSKATSSDARLSGPASCSSVTTTTGCATQGIGEVYALI